LYVLVVSLFILQQLVCLDWLTWPHVLGCWTAFPAARGLSLPGADAGGPFPTTHIHLCYDQECYSTTTQHNSSSPIFNETFALQVSLCELLL
jgi:hypothetical protein